MKHLLIILLLLFPIISHAADTDQRPIQLARMNPYVAGAVSAAPACTNITVDLWQNLDATDFLSNMPSGWSKVDASNKLTMSTSGELSTLSCPGSVADTGTRGLAYDATGGAIARLLYTSDHGTTSFGFWFKTGVHSTWYNAFILNIESTVVITYGCGASCPNGYIYIYGGTGTAVSVADNTWYWVTVKFVKNGASLMRVYDTTGSQVGNEMSIDTPDSVWTKAYFGIGDNLNDTSTLYFDDIMMDWTNAVFPLGP
jgi:hypothetical protein